MSKHFASMYGQSHNGQAETSDCGWYHTSSSFGTATLHHFLVCSFSV